MSDKNAPTYVAPVEEVRVSPDGHMVARRIPFVFTRENAERPQWIAMYFVEHVGFTVEIFDEQQMADWTVIWMRD
jgi:hypothetical protein